MLTSNVKMCSDDVIIQCGATWKNITRFMVQFIVGVMDTF